MAAGDSDVGRENEGVGHGENEGVGHGENEGVGHGENEASGVNAEGGQYV